ncbi:hypothetical protein [Streptomyces sp. NPDC014734]|uniref:hypothetical protein n=1 Tax=Streptomyces sp. NPDC014734 TaxID=3364886 RepID=UPI0036FEB1BE
MRSPVGRAGRWARRRTRARARTDAVDAVPVRGPLAVTTFRSAERIDQVKENV